LIQLPEQVVQLYIHKAAKATTEGAKIIIKKRSIVRYNRRAFW